MERLSTKFLHSKRRRPIAAAVSLLALMALAACGVTKVDIYSMDRKDLHIPIPLVQQLPITVGVHYDEKLRNHYKIETYGLGGDEIEYYLGPPSIALFDPLFSAMFEKVVPVESHSTTSVDGQKISAVLALTIERFFGPKDLTTIVRKTSWLNHPQRVAYIRYSLALYAPPGVKKTSVSAENAHDMAHGSFFIPTAVARAMRNAALGLFVKFNNDSDVTAWMASHGISERGAEKKSR